MRAQKYIPIFNVIVHIRTYKNGQDVVKASKAIDKEPGTGYVRGMIHWDPEKPFFYMLLSEEELDIDLVTHEVSHLTHAILEYHSLNKKGDHELFALLTGYLNDIVTTVLSKKGFIFGPA